MFLTRFLGTRSFIKVPSKVLNVLTNLQRKFLWRGRGSDDNKKIPYVGLNTVCHAKKDGDLGVKKIAVILGLIHCPCIIYFRDCSLCLLKKMRLLRIWGSGRITNGLGYDIGGARYMTGRLFK